MVERGDGRQFRRAVTLLLMTLVVPGAAQLVAGNRQVGRVAVRVAAGAVAVAALLAFIGLVSPRTLVSLLANAGLLRVLQLLLVALALGWLALFVDAWRLGGPLGLHQKQRLTSTAMTLGLSALAVSLVLTSSHYVAVARHSLKGVFAGTKVTDPYAGRYNVLLLGADADADRVGLRPDSITLASIDEKTGRTALFSFPRNLQRVPFPRGTVMHKAFPNGFDCGNECLLNALYTWATDHRALFPRDVADPGIEAMKDAVRGITGLDVNYYALVDIKGFQELVDAVGGVSLDVKRDLPITGPGGELRATIKAGPQRLDGYHALWYARSRSDSSDYDRMARQRCVMAAMLHQLEPGNVLLKFREIARAGEQIVSTDIPASELDTMTGLAMKAKKARITSVQFVPPLITTARPDFPLIRRTVRAAIDESTGRTRSRSPAASPAPKASDASRSSGGGAVADSPQNAAATPDPSASPTSNVDNLDQVCTAG
jgi:polyisoprenyl-teichoic acid--peptidoglycan teichoic acid transferase